MEFRRKARNPILSEELLLKNCKYSVSTGTLYSWKKKHEKQEKLV
jgi:hypothetical protein